MKKTVFTFIFLILFINFNFSPCFPSSITEDTGKEKNLFNLGEYLAHLKFLSSDLLEGRATGTRGSALTELYIATQFEALGLQPIDQARGYFQKIVFDGFDTLEDSLKARFKNASGSFEAVASREIALVSELADREDIRIEGDLLFVGYGIKSPEYHWDDFKRTKIKGKIIVSLVNDPDFKKTGFGSESMTYYGRWTYKIEQARKLQAKALLLIHHNNEATYGWNVVETGWINERVHFKGQPENPLAFHGWISHQVINRILKGSRLDYEKLKTLATRRNFKPFSLKTSASISFRQKYRTLESANVIGIIPGTDQNLKKEAVIYTGHFDHLGKGKADQSGDTIYNGALDNASGIAALLCLARVFKNSATPCRRTLIFMPVTAEELGLFGSLWYVTHPLIPLKDTVLVINKDCMSFYGRRNGFRAFPVEYTTALPEIRAIGENMGLKLLKRTRDIGGGAFRSDHFPFAARGITALSVSLSGDNISISREEEKAIREKIGPTYHRPNDEIHPLWRYDGILQELMLLYKIGRHWVDGAMKPKMSMSETNPYRVTMQWFGIKQE